MPPDERLPVPQTPALHNKSALASEQIEWAYGAEPARDPDLPNIGAMLRRRWLSITLTGASVLAIVAALTFLWPETYESNTTILVEKRQGVSNSPVLAVLDRLGPRNEIETEIELIRSRGVVESVVDLLDLHVTVETADGQKPPTEVFAAFTAGHDSQPGSYRLVRSQGHHYEIRDAKTDRLITKATPDGKLRFAGLVVTLPENDLQTDTIIQTIPFTSAVNAVRSRIVASRVRRDADIINVTCSAGTAHAAHQLCQAIMESYMRLRTVLQRAEATATAAFLRKQVPKIGGELAAAEERFEEYAREHGVVALKAQAIEGVRQFSEVTAQREQLEAERASLASLIRKLEGEESDTRKYRELATFPTFLKSGDGSGVGNLMASLVELETRRSELALRRTELNPDLAAIDTRIHEVEGQILSVSSSYENALAAQIASLDTILEKSSQRLAVIPTEQVETARLEREVTLLGDLNRLLGTRLREAEVAEAVNLPSARLVDSASWPEGPSMPKVALNLKLGLILGIASGISLAYFRELKDTRFRERHEVVRETGLPVLSMIPHLRLPKPVLAVGLTRLDTSESIREGAGPEVAGGSRSHRRSIKLEEETQIALESFRSLATDLTFAARHLENGALGSVAITSSTRGEGKTFTACNLAIVRASHGVRTLLIDADMRVGGVTSFFGLPLSAPGLREVLADNIDIQSVLKTIRVDNSDSSRLTVLTSGRTTDHSAGLLESRKFGLLLRGMMNHFDLIVIDTPPLNLITDAATIAAATDAVALVVRAGVTDHASLEMTLERLRRADGHVLGVVLNDVRLSTTYTGRYHYMGSDNHESG